MNQTVFNRYVVGILNIFTLLQQNCLRINNTVLITNNSKEFIEDDKTLISKITDFVDSYDEQIKANPESFEELITLF